MWLWARYKFRRLGLSKNLLVLFGHMPRGKSRFKRQSRTGPNNSSASSNQPLSSRKSLTLSSLSKAERMCRVCSENIWWKVIRVDLRKTNFYRELRHFISSAYPHVEHAFLAVPMRFKHLSLLSRPPQFDNASSSTHKGKRALSRLITIVEIRKKERPLPSLSSINAPRERSHIIVPPIWPSPPSRLHK